MWTNILIILTKNSYFLLNKKGRVAFNGTKRFWYRGLSCCFSAEWTSKKCMSIISLNLLNEMYLEKLILITKWLNPCLQYDLLSKCLSTVIIVRNQKCNPHYQLLIEGKISLRIVYISCMNADITNDLMEVGQRQKKQ
jgi:hypothetical protein